MKRSPITRLGSENAIRADVRVIAATNRDLEQLIREGRFREDLYYQLNVFPRFVPPLRERRTDILLLADYYAIDPRRFRSAAAAPSR